MSKKIIFQRSRISVLNPYLVCDPEEAYSHLKINTRSTKCPGSLISTKLPQIYHGLPIPVDPQMLNVFNEAWTEYLGEQEYLH